MASTGKQLPVGLRYVTVYELLSTGMPEAGAVPATPYEGIEFSGPKAFTLNVPEARKITHIGEDRPLAIDYLPPTDGMDGELQVSPSEFNVVAALGDIVMETVAEKTFVPLSSDKQGFEPQVGVLMYQQSLDVDSGVRTYRSFIIPSARCVYMPAGMGQDTEDNRYKIAPAVTNQHLWGTDLVLGTDGCTSIQAIELHTVGRPMLCAWQSAGGGGTTEFNFPTSKPNLFATRPNSIVVWSEGVLYAQGGGAGQVQPDATKLTFGAALVDKTVVCFYEW